MYIAANNCIPSSNPGGREEEEENGTCRYICNCVLLLARWGSNVARKRKEEKIEKIK